MENMKNTAPAPAIDIAFNAEYQKVQEEGKKRINDILNKFIPITDEFIKKYNITNNELYIMCNTLIHRETTASFDRICLNKTKKIMLDNQIKKNQSKILHNNN